MRACNIDHPLTLTGSALTLTLTLTLTPTLTLTGSAAAEDNDNDGWEPEWWEVRRPRFRWGGAADEDEDEDEDEEYFFEEDSEVAAHVSLFVLVDPYGSLCFPNGYSITASPLSPLTSPTFFSSSPSFSLHRKAQPNTFILTLIVDHNLTKGE